MKYLGKNEKGQMRLSRRAVLMRDAEVPSAISSGDVVKTIASRAEDAYSS